MKLSDLGLKKGGIAETIVTTYNADMSPNAAPMGVYALGERHVGMRIHTDSDTYNNLIRNKCCVINISFDPYLFLSTTLLGSGKGASEIEVRPGGVQRAKNVKAPFLKESSAYIEAELREHNEYLRKDEYGEIKVSEVKCEVRNIVSKGVPVAVNRGLFAAIELAIGISRNKKVDAKEYLRIMEATLPSGEYKKILRFLRGKIKDTNLL